jgi:hypothetical protein
MGAAAHAARTVARPSRGRLERLRERPSDLEGTPRRGWGPLSSEAHFARWVIPFPFART